LRATNGATQSIRIDEIRDNGHAFPGHPIHESLKTSDAVARNDNVVIPPPVWLKVRHVTGGNRSESVKPRQENAEKTCAAQVCMNDSTTLTAKKLSDPSKLSFLSLKRRFEKGNVSVLRLGRNPGTRSVQQKDLVPDLRQFLGKIVTVSDSTVDFSASSKKCDFHHGKIQPRVASTKWRSRCPEYRSLRKSCFLDEIVSQ
jgi:hypothetical protein